MKQLRIVLLGIMISNILLSQEKIDKELLKKDLDVLKANLEAYHTGLYTYTSKEEFDQWYLETKKQLEDTTPLGFYKKITELNTLIKNGHTFFHINPEQRGKNVLMPPITIYKDQERFYIKSILNSEKPEIIGKQIIAINAIPIGDIFTTLLRYEERDGENLTQPTEELLYSFARKFALEYGNHSKTHLDIKDQQISKKVIISNIPFEKVTNKTDALNDNGGAKFVIKDTVGIVTVETFREEPLKRDKYRASLKTFFKKIKNQQIKHLIIDVRNNGGGDSESVEELISYLYDKPFTYYKDVYQQHKKWDSSIIPEVSSYPKNMSSWTLKKGADGYYRAFIGVDGMSNNKPKKDTYKENLYILINGSTLSAAAEFASFIKNYRKATFIGDEAGGNKVQNTSGYSLIIGLPNSKIIAAIPIILWKMNVEFKNDGHGVIPDYSVSNTIEDEINSRDGVMEFTLDLIRKTKGRHPSK
ncbi:hypothetical protein HN014_18400 [Aquimarina sp. TRL1]|nr:hypothetical protein HN014_18400 [Aquimarina sp. TRL1]